MILAKSYDFRLSVLNFIYIQANKIDLELGQLVNSMSIRNNNS